MADILSLQKMPIAKLSFHTGMTAKLRLSLVFPRYLTLNREIVCAKLVKEQAHSTQTGTRNWPPAFNVSTTLQGFTTMSWASCKHSTSSSAALARLAMMILSFKLTILQPMLDFLCNFLKLFWCQLRVLFWVCLRLRRQRLPPRIARHQIQKRLLYLQPKLLFYHRFRSLKAAIMTTACVKQFNLKVLSFSFARHTQLQSKPQLRAIQHMSLCATINRRASHPHVLVFSLLRLRLNLPHRPNLRL
jgi:hypothetical protein